MGREQSKATHSVDSTCPAYHRKFDVDKLMWEFNFMLDHYVDDFCDSPLDGFAKKELSEVFTLLCESITKEKQLGRFPKKPSSGASRYRGKAGGHQA